MSWPFAAYVVRSGSKGLLQALAPLVGFPFLPRSVGTPGQGSARGASPGWSCVVPLLVLGHQKGQKPGDKGCDRAVPLTALVVGGQLHVHEPCLAPGLQPLVVPAVWISSERECC